MAPAASRLPTGNGGIVRRGRVIGAVVGVAALVAGGTSVVVAHADEQPVDEDPGFRRSVGETRVFEAYRRSSTSAAATARVPAGTRHLRVRMDCIGTGEISVHVDALTAAVPCQDRSDSRGAIDFTKQRASTRSSKARVRVVAPRGSHWSVVVEAGPGKLDHFASDLP